MATPEEKLEALTVEAELAEEVRDRLLSPEGRARLEAAGYEVAKDAWGDPVAKAPYESAYKEAAVQLRVLDVLGDELATALVALAQLGRAREAREIRAEALARAGTEADGG